MSGGSDLTSRTLRMRRKALATARRPLFREGVRDCLPLAVGTALGLRAQGLDEPAVWVLVGDAELDEGSNHEAIAYAGAAGLSRLHTLVIDNSSATHGWHGGIAAQFEAAGWSAVTADGRDHEALHKAFAAPHPGRPHAVVAQVEPKDTGEPKVA